MTTPRYRPIEGQASLFDPADRVAYCKVCRRRLRTPASIKRGVGSGCASREGKVSDIVWIAEGRFRTVWRKPGRQRTAAETHPDAVVHDFRRAAKGEESRPASRSKAARPAGKGQRGPGEMAGGRERSRRSGSQRAREVQAGATDVAISTPAAPCIKCGGPSTRLCDFVLGVCPELGPEGRTITCDAPHSRSRTYAACVETIPFPLTHEEVRRSATGFARVPLVPPAIRDQTKGKLRDYHILWEVDRWFDSHPDGFDRDPILLKRLGSTGTLFAVVGQWDLTPLELAILNSIQQTEAR